MLVIRLQVFERKVNRNFFADNPFEKMGHMEVQIKELRVGILFPTYSYRLSCFTIILITMTF